MGLIICPDCKSEISDQAPQCPKCGRPRSPAPTETRAPKKRFGCLGIGCLSIIGLAVLIALISSLTQRDSGPPTSPGTAGIPEPTVDNALLTQAQNLVDECQRKGVLGDIRYSIITRAVVKPAFYTFEFDSKVGVARSLGYIAKAKGFSGTVIFLDAYTNREVGELNPYTGKLDWKK